MADDVPAKTILRTARDIRDGTFTQPGWQRSRGRPPTSWTQQIISDRGLRAWRSQVLKVVPCGGRTLRPLRLCADDDDDDDDE